MSLQRLPVSVSEINPASRRSQFLILVIKSTPAFDAINFFSTFFDKMRHIERIPSQQSIPGSQRVFHSSDKKSQKWRHHWRDHPSSFAKTFDQSFQVLVVLPQAIFLDKKLFRLRRYFEMNFLNKSTFATNLIDLRAEI